MSAKTLIIAAAALAASTAMTVPSFAAGGDGTGPNGTGPGRAANPPAASQTVPLRAQILFNLLDANHDGAVDQQEFASLSTAIFNALDKNHDGKLTPDELRADFAMFGQRGGRFGPPGMGPHNRGPQAWHGRFDGHGWGHGPMQGERGPGMGRMGFNGPGPQGPGPQQRFANLDSNGDGVITLDEFTAHMPPAPPAPPAQGPDDQAPAAQQ